MNPSRQRTAQGLPVEKVPRGNILFVSNINPKLNYEQVKEGLYALFSVHGPIFDITIKTKENGTHFAFVDFPNIQDADEALKASKKNGKILQGKQLIVNYCEDPKKNEDRKGQKCFICHSVGHKAKNCTVRPELIKVKPKKVTVQKVEEDSGTSSSDTDMQSQSEEISQLQDTECTCDCRKCKLLSRRDPDYLKFLELKRKIIKKRLRKMISRKQ